MARQTQYDSDPIPGGIDDVPDDADMSAVRSILPQSDRPASPKFERMRPPPNPSEPRRLQLDDKMLHEILPQVQQNSKDADEYAENLKRVFRALFKAQYGAEPDANDMTDIDGHIKLQMELYNFRQPQAPADNLIRQHHDELQDYQEEFQRQNKN